MASLFAHNRILPNLKRRARSSKSDASPTKAKPLHILPNLAEEDELPRHSCSSTSSVPSASHPSRFASGCATVGGRPSADQVIHIKRDSRRVVLTGAEGLSFDDFFPPSSAPRVRTPSPPPMTRSPSPPPRSAASSPGSDSPLDDINLRFSGLGISLDFPSPPSASIRSSARSFSRRREQSPTPSNASSESSSSYSSPKTPCTTPPTSDDESPCKSNLARAPTFKSQRASILFMKSMPDLSEPVRKSSFSSIVDDDSIMEELEWIARDISEVVTLSTPLPPTFPATPTEASMNAHARPDSVMPLSRRESHLGRAVPPVPRISIQDSSERQRPSAQLDPTFPLRRRSYMVPTRPPPPPPAPKSPISSMEQATEDLLAELANAALGAGFLGTELTVPQDGFLSTESLPSTPSSQFIVTSPSGLRPLPRFSVPDDINDFGDESPVELVVPDLTSHMWPTTPQTPQSISVYSQMSEYSPPTSPLSSFDFEVDVSHILSHREEAAAALECASTLSRSPSTVSLVPSERPLRSRWSSSTLSSLVEGSSHSTSWLPRFNLSPSKKNKSKPAPAPAPAHTAGPLQRKNAVKAGHGAKRSVDSDRGLTRRDSRASRMSESSASDSGESTTSSGLKRKPIPMALLATSA